MTFFRSFSNHFLFLTGAGLSLGLVLRTIRRSKGLTGLFFFFLFAVLSFSS